MEEQSLLEKLKERLSWQNISNNSIVKRAKNITLAFVLTLALTLTTSCGNTNGTTSGGNTNDDTHISEGNNSTIITPDGDKVDISEYSEILRNVLTKDYYSSLIAEGKVLQSKGNQSYRTANKFQAIPYGFLEDEGYDIDAIKNDELKCETDIFVLDGELYIACRVENKASIDYYTHYVIKYSLTEKELSDLNLTHQQLSEGGNTIRTVSFQAPFFIQELSLQKNATVLSKAHITKESEEFSETHLETTIKKDSNIDMSGFSNNISTTYLQFWNEAGKLYTTQFLFFNDITQSTDVIQTKKLSKINFTGYYTNGMPTIDNLHVHTGLVPSQVLEQYYDEVSNSKKTATFYNTYNSSFIDMLTPKYSSYYGLE